MSDTPTEILLRQLAERAGYDFDQILLQALRNAVGDQALTLADSRAMGEAGRLTATTFQVDQRTVYAIDGKPFLEAWPLESKLTANSLTTTKSYRALMLDRTVQAPR